MVLSVWIHWRKTNPCLSFRNACVNNICTCDCTCSVVCANIIYPLTLPEFSLCYLILFFYATLGSVDLAWTPSESVYYGGSKYNSRGTVLKLG